MRFIRVFDDTTYKTPKRALDLGRTRRALPKTALSGAAAMIAIVSAVVAPVATTYNIAHSQERLVASSQKIDSVLVAASKIENETEAAEYVAAELDASDIANVIAGVVAPEIEIAPADEETAGEIAGGVDAADELSQGSRAADAATEKAPDYSKITSADFEGLSQDEKIELMGAMAREDDRLTGIPASLTVAQAILESGWMESGLTTKYENYFGIKASSDGYNWEDSTWDGRVADMATGEEYDGYQVTITAGFRVYDSAWESICDHSAYLLHNTKNDGAERRYPDIEKCESAADAVDLLVDGGYATSSSYAEMLMELVEKYDLTRFDYTESPGSAKMDETSNSKNAESAGKDDGKTADKSDDKSGDDKPNADKKGAGSTDDKNAAKTK